MTLDEIKKAVQHIEDIAGDNESAHGEEDSLRAAFIAYVAETADGELAEMSREVLKTDDINFARWYA